jgi:type IV secretory pathway VirB2 component (pilin)
MKNSPLKMMFFMLLLAEATPMFAADIMPPGMKSLVDSILEVFTGGFVKTILIIFLAACAVAYGFNKDNEKMKRNILAIGVSIAIIVGAQWIVDAIWKASGR